MWYGGKQARSRIAMRHPVRDSAHTRSRRNPGGAASSRALPWRLDIERSLTLPLGRGTTALVKADVIARSFLAPLSVADVDRWHARLRKAGVGEGSLRNQHLVLRAALAQAVRWDGC